ncbi:octopamine receptor Oamb-like [Oppia nitens]|uniref:octopamine receptor Oamb-like n=1 Tax=Oppia nitens TaxID=1686743 RepID=UPI0023DC3588|nr:octopamine receptor Oamb-like [Oppia nitens]
MESALDSLVNNSKNQSLNPTPVGGGVGAANVGDDCGSISSKFNDATVIVSVVILGLINVIVIAGNILVIVSVFVSAKLRTVTNFFIVSLAVADLLVGIAVIPYSLSLEILDVWIFGELWCQGWLVTDVWLCTASILNLCAISIDRYLAVTRPVRYRSMMTSKRAKIVIACVWVVSFIICFPPLVGWNDSNTSFLQLSKPDNTNNNNNNNNPGIHLPTVVTQTYVNTFDKPLLTTTTTATVTAAAITTYSSDFVSNSFHQHLDLMNTSSIITTTPTTTTTTSTSTITSRSMSNITNNHDINANTNHINSLADILNYTSQQTPHSSRDCSPSRIKCEIFQNKGYVIYSALGSFYIPMFVMAFFYWRIYLVASRTSRALSRGYKTTKCNGSHDERLTLRIHRGYGEDVQSGGQNTYLSTQNETNTLNTSFSGSRSRSSNLRLSSHNNDNTDQSVMTAMRSGKKGAQSKDFGPVITVTSNANINNNTGAGGSGGGGKKHMPITLYRSSKLTASLSPNNYEQNGQNRRMSPSNQSTLSLPSSSSPCSSREGSARSGKLVINRFSKRTSKYQAKRFHAETKAAKTVGIIVGGFILCWLPFFTVYLARAFCMDEDCIPNLLLSIFIWLGYCNSMINPCIYGLFSKDFRRAFRNIICRCKFREETVSSLIRQIHMPTFFEDMPEDMVKPDSQED